MSKHHDINVPKGAIYGAAAMMIIAIGVAAGARTTHATLADTSRASPVVEAVDLRFEDRPDGAVAVLDADTRREVQVVPPESNGFVRGVLRGMFRGRKLERLGPDARFRLSRHANGQISLEDTDTGRYVELSSFGHTNRAAFETMLVAATKKRAP